MTGLSKYEELHNKTNEQLILVVERELDRAARHAAEEPAKAEKSWTKASRLLLLAYDIPTQEQKRLEQRVEQLRQVLADAALTACVGG